LGEQSHPKQVVSFRKFIFSVLVILMLSSQASAGAASHGLESDSEDGQLDERRDSEDLLARSQGQNRSSGAEICVNCTKKQVTKTKVEKMNASRIQDELKNIREKITQKKAKWTPKETAVSRLSLKDRKSLFGAKFDPASKLSSLSIPGNVSIPIGTFDWRSVNGSNWMTPVKNQGPCGSCWAFGTLGSMEAVINIASRDPNKDVDLSEQFLVSCCKGNYPLCGFGCGGGYPDAAYRYIKNNGIPDDACFPYVASDVSCSHCPDWQSRAWFISSWNWVSSDRNSIKWALRTYGPLGVAMYAPNDFLYYGGGIYESVWSSKEWDKEFPFGSANHWVTLAGYDDAQGYWIVKNSWGEGWGEQGYGKIAFGVLEQHDYILVIQSVRSSSTPEHDLEVTVQAPSILRPSTQALLNATVRNKGSSNEANVVVRLLANGTTIHSQSFSSLPKGESRTISHTWTPFAEGWHNITGYSPPLASEEITSNNAASDWDSIKKSLLFAESLFY